MTILPISIFVIVPVLLLFNFAGGHLVMAEMKITLKNVVATQRNTLQKYSKECTKCRMLQGPH